MMKRIPDKYKSTVKQLKDGRHKNIDLTGAGISPCSIIVLISYRIWGFLYYEVCRINFKVQKDYFTKIGQE